MQNCVSARRHEKGLKHEMPYYHVPKEYLTAYLEGCTLREDREGRYSIRLHARLTD